MHPKSVILRIMMYKITIALSQYIKVKKNIFAISVLILFLLQSYQTLAQTWQPLGPSDKDQIFARGAASTCMTFVGQVPYVAFYNSHETGILVRRPVAGGTGWETVGGQIYVRDAGSNISLVVNNARLYIFYTASFARGRQLAVKRLKTDATGWESVGPEGFSSGQADNVSVAFNGTTPYVAYQDEDNASKLTVMKYNAGANTWDVVGKAGFSADKIYYTSIGFNGATPYVAYAEGENKAQGKVAKLNGAGTDWEQVGKTAISVYPTTYIKLAFNGATPYIAYEDNRQNATVKKLNAAGTDWELVGTAGFLQGLPTYLAFAFNNGVPYVASADGSDHSRATVMRLNSAATGWEKVGQSPISSSSVTFLNLVFNGNTPYVSFSDNSYFLKPQVMKLNAAGTTWEPLATLGISLGYASSMNLAINGNTPYVVYRDNGNNNKASVMRYNTSTSGWEYVGNPGFTPTIGDINKIPLAFAKAIPYIAIADFSQGDKISVMRLNATGTGWETAGPAGFSTGKVTTPISLAVSGTTPYVVYGDQVLKVKRLNAAGTAWEDVGNPFTVNTIGATSIIFKGTVPYVAFADASNSSRVTLVRLNTAGKWETVGTPGFAPSGSNSLAFSGDIPYVACAGASQKLYLYRLKADGTGWESLITPSSSDTGTGFISLTFDGDTPYISTVRDNKGVSVVTYNTAGNDWQDVGGYSVSSADGLNTSISILDHKLYLAYDSFGAFVKTYSLTSVQSAAPLTGGPGTTVTIAGTGFTGTTAVTFGGVPAQSFRVVSATSITAVVGNNAASGDIKVITPANISSIKGFVYLPAPAISSFTPAFGITGVKITITGTNFTGATAVKFGTTAAASFVVNSATSITATTGAGATGKISVTTPGGTATSAATFTYNETPVITSFTPVKGPAGTKVNLVGTGFTGATAVSFGGVPAQLFTVYSATAITAVVDDGGKTGKITVTTPGGTVTSATEFTFETTPAPAIIAFTPTQASGATKINLTGTGFTGTTSVSFGGVPATVFTVISDTQLTATISNAGASGDITVVTPAGTGSIKGFVFTKPTLISVFSPVAATEGTAVTITGQSFTTANGVSFGNTPAKSFVINSDTKITAIIGKGSSGVVSVFTPSGGAVADGFVYVSKPVIAPSGPTTFTTGGSVTLNTVSAAGYTYQWLKDGKNITGTEGTRYSYTATTTGVYAVNVTYGGIALTSDPVNVTVIFDLPADNFKASATSATCKGENNGIINITALQNLNYKATITGNGLNKSYPFTSAVPINDLSPGTYNVCITVSGQADYQQCYDLAITEPKDLAVFSSVNKATNSLNLELNGSDNYAVELNGTVYHTSESSLSLPLLQGSNKLVVATDKLCQGIIEKNINLSNTMLPYPNPFQDVLNVNLGDTPVTNCTIKVFNIADGKLLYQQKIGNQSGVIQVALSALRSGTYSLNMSMDNRESVFKIIKK